MYQEKAQKDTAASAKITCVPVFPQGKHKWGEKFQFRKVSRDLAESQEMEQHHLEANTGKAGASSSFNECGVFIAFQEINE